MQSILPTPVKTASQCRVSGVRGPDPLSVSSSMRPDGAGHVPAAVRRRGSPGRGSARRHARSGPVVDGGGSGGLCHSHHVPSVISRSARRVARTARYASSLLRRVADAAARSPRPPPGVSAGAIDGAAMIGLAGLPTPHSDIDQPTSERSARRRQRLRRRPPASARSSTCRTIRSRPRGVSRAFLWMFIRSSRESLKPRNSSCLGLDRMDNLIESSQLDR